MKEMPQKKDRIRIGVYIPHIYDELDEAQVAALAEAGVDYPILGFNGFFSQNQEKRQWLLDMYEKYGLEALIFDQNITSPMEVLGSSVAQIFDSKKAAAADWYRDHPAFAGSTFVDEPGILHFEKLGQTVEEYKSMFPGKVPYINLLPMYANNAQLTGGAWMDKIDYYDTSENDFRRYLSEYVKHVKTDYIGVDIYPCFSKDGEKTTYNEYIKAIELCADACRDSGREFWVCVQTCSWNFPHVRIPDETDFTWQVHTMLAFGAKTLFYYVFSDRGVHQGCPYGVGGVKRELWYTSRRITSELRKLSDEYVKYSWIGAFTRNCTKDTPYLEMYSPLESFAPVKEVSSSGPLLVGCFKGIPEKGAAGSNAVYLANESDPAAPVPTEVRLLPAGKAVAYVGGERIVPTPDSEGFISFIIPPGGGMFVTIE